MCVWTHLPALVTWRMEIRRCLVRRGSSRVKCPMPDYTVLGLKWIFKLIRAGTGVECL